MATLLGLLDPGDGGTMILLNFSNYLSVNRHKIAGHFDLHQHHHENLKTHTYFHIFNNKYP